MQCRIYGCNDRSCASHNAHKGIFYLFSRYFHHFLLVKMKTWKILWEGNWNKDYQQFLLNYWNLWLQLVVEEFSRYFLYFSRYYFSHWNSTKWKVCNIKDEQTMKSFQLLHWGCIFFIFPFFSFSIFFFIKNFPHYIFTFLFVRENSWARK